jgi:hypothetical protein
MDIIPYVNLNNESLKMIKVQMEAGERPDSLGFAFMIAKKYTFSSMKDTYI